MNLVLSILLVCAAVTTITAGESNFVSGKSTNVPVQILDEHMEKEYQKLLDLDDEAQAEIDEWVKKAYDISTNSSPLATATLRFKIEQRLEPVKNAYEDFLKKYPKHVKARVAYASFLSDIGKEEESFKQLQMAKETDPKNPAVWNNLANYYGHNEQPTNAFVHYQKAIELNPKEPVYFKNYATTIYMFREEAMEFFNLTEEKVIEKSVQLYKKALELDPRNFIIASDLAQTFYGYKIPKLSIKDLKSDKKTQEIASMAIKAWEMAGELASNDVEKQGVKIHITRWMINSGHFDEAKKNLDSIDLEIYASTKEALLKKLESMLEELKKEKASISSDK